MFKPRRHYADEKPQCTFPTTKLKNIKCVICKHQFYVRDLGHLKGSHLPLLSNCGHAVCQDCGANQTLKTCPLCKMTLASDSSEAKNLLPVNVHVIGLMCIAQARARHGEGEVPNISFSQPIAARTKQLSAKLESCSTCGVEASIRCSTCNNALFCQRCSDKIHKEPKNPLQSTGHRGFGLATCSNDFVAEFILCKEHYQEPDYYCENCNVPGCSHCMVQLHSGHKCVYQSVKNEEHAEDFEKVYSKLVETMHRVQHTEKKLNEALKSTDEFQNTEIIEAAINQHFLRLHGVLQNFEKRMIDKLYEQSSHVKKNLSDLQRRLSIMQDQVYHGLLMAAAAKEMGRKFNLMDVISKLEELANVPCHLVRDPIAKNEEITFSNDTSIFEALENHCKIVVPEVAEFKLLTEDALPTDYEIVPLVTEEFTARDQQVMLEPSLKRIPSCQSLSSCRSDNKVSKHGQFQKGHNTVRICHVENPSNFYVRLAALQRQVDDLLEKIADYAKNELQEPIEVKENKIYAVQHSGDKWYRGRVNAIHTEHDSPDTYEIFNVDFGKTEHGVTKSRIRCIPAEMATKPQTIVNCSLFDIKPSDGEWRTGARQSMLKIMKAEDNCAVDMFIVKQKDNRYLVDLCPKPSILGEGSVVSVRDSLIFSGEGISEVSQQFHLQRTNPQSVRGYFREDLKFETYYDVKCSHVESPDCIYIQKSGDYLLHLAVLSNEMSTNYNQVAKHRNATIAVPEIGMPCAIEKAEGLWCRGVINGVPAPQTVEVFLVDFGSKIITDCKKIRKLHEIYMKSSTQAIKISLADIKPCNGDKWPEDAIKFTKEQLKDAHVRIVAFRGLDCAYSVVLYLNGDTNFGTLLVTNGLAISTGPRSFEMVEAPIKQTNSKKRNGKVRNARTLKKNISKRPINRPSAPSFDQPTEGTDPFRVPVKIIRVESPDAIYVSDPFREAEYQKMLVQMQKFYNRFQKGSDKHEWTVGSSCAVYSTLDRCFCRGKITAIDSPDQAQVFLFDLAFNETFPIADLQPLKRAFWRTKTHAFKVKLAGLSPCGGSSSWVASSCAKLKEMMDKNSNSNFYISKVIQPGEQDLYVELWFEQSKINGPFAPTEIETRCINRMMIEEGFALPIKQLERSKMLAVELKRQVFGTNEKPKNEDSKFIENNKSAVDSDDDETVRACVSSVVGLSDFNVDTLVSNDEVVTSWPPAEPIAGDKFIAMATYVDNDCKVYLHSIAQTADMLKSIGNILLNKYASSTPTPEDLVWAEGDLCIAEYHADKKWYRGQVREILEDGKTKVELIDYGNIEDCDIGTLRKNLILTDIPRQSTKCVIYGLYPATADGEWNTDDLDRIHFVLVEQKCAVRVLERANDHLVVTIKVLTPEEFYLKWHLMNVLELEVQGDRSDECSSSDEVDDDSDESSTDCNDDVIVEGFLDDRKSDEDDDNANEKDVGKETDGSVNRENVEEEEADDFRANDIEENATIAESVEMIDADTRAKDISNESVDDSGSTSERSGNNESTVIEEVPIPPPVEPSPESSSFVECEVVSLENTIDLIDSDPDVVLSGTVISSCICDQTKLNNQEASSENERISLPDSCFSGRDELVTSTPYNESFDCDSYGSYKKFVFPDELKVFEAEIAVYGSNACWLHLLDNKSSKIITELRALYDKIRDDLCRAETQPILGNFKTGTPCCAKFEGEWCRCEVIDCESPPYASGDIVRVRFVDWGNVQDVTCDEIRVMEPEWIETPPMGLYCKLWGVELAPTVDVDELNRKITEVFIRYITPPRPVYVELKDSAKGIYSVQIYSDKACTELIYDSLIKEGLFVPRATTKIE